jgi:glycerophosphoryl diester phosphodiesterase
MSNHILKIAHRGGAGYAPENTFLAFDNAIKLGVDMLECDVRLCKTGELILMHDKDIERTTNGKGKVARLTLQELKKLDAGSGQEIPTLAEFFERYKNTIPFMVDVKSPTIAKQLALLIKFHNVREQVHITSSNHGFLTAMRWLDKKIDLQISFNIYNYLKYFFVRSTFVISAKLFDASTINIYHKFATKNLINAAHDFGIKVNAFPPSGESDIERLRQDGIDGIISNFPDKI